MSTASSSPSSPALALPRPSPRTRSPTSLAVAALRTSMETPPPPPKRVVVCGGGVIGVCTAYFLSKSSAAASVALVEQSSVACAASGKAGGFLALDWCDGGPLGPLARASFDLHRALAEELDGPRAYGYRALTTLSLTVKESETESGQQRKRPPPRDGVLPYWVDGPGRAAREIGSTGTTAQVHPQLFTRALLDKAVRDYGLEVVIGKAARVDAGDGGGGGGGGRVSSVVLEGGRVMEADAVVLALGPWSGKFGLLSSLFGVYGLKAHSIVLEPREPGAIGPEALFLSFLPAAGGPAMDPEVYPRPTGEVYLCGMSSREEVPDDPDEVAPDPESIKVLKRVARAVSTHLAAEGGARVKAEQACFLPCTEDEVPVIGELPGLEGCYVATGHSCWGILNGPATGAAVAELVLEGRARTVDLTRFSPARFVGSRKR
ncbi:putative oxidoreductase TDA3 [Syzygium oleosum]|uniref:putative oxidoreductase TDA3 n=1 Tax=Syzygium oleosum TaxID=219896 RepID=UPI0024BA6122|nr:putative oxidoreductase TDA3 [Syzygium oleosum]